MCGLFVLIFGVPAVSAVFVVVYAVRMGNYFWNDGEKPSRAETAIVFITFAAGVAGAWVGIEEGWWGQMWSRLWR